MCEYNIKFLPFTIHSKNICFFLDHFICISNKLAIVDNSFIYFLSSLESAFLLVVEIRFTSAVSDTLRCGRPQTSTLAV